MKTIAFWAAYVAVAFLTFGHVFNANYVPHRECGERPHSVHVAEEYVGWYDCRFGQPRPTPVFVAGYPAALVAAVWPAYWAGRVAIEVTRPAKDVSREDTVERTSATIGDLFDELLGP